jgi:hypothetical protein
MYILVDFFPMSLSSQRERGVGEDSHVIQIHIFQHISALRTTENRLAEHGSLLEVKGGGQSQKPPFQNYHYMTLCVYLS